MQNNALSAAFMRAFYMHVTVWLLKLCCSCQVGVAFVTLVDLAAALLCLVCVVRKIAKLLCGCGRVIATKIVARAFQG